MIDGYSTDVGIYLNTHVRLASPIDFGHETAHLNNGEPLRALRKQTNSHLGLLRELLVLGR